MGWILSLVFLAGVVVALVLLLRRATRAQREAGIRDHGHGSLGVGSFSYDDAEEHDRKPA